MLVLGVDVYCHDGSACLVRDGRILAALSEERLTRQKHCRGYRRAAAYCLEAAGAEVGDLDLLCVSHPFLSLVQGYRKFSIYELGGRTFVLGRDLRFIDHYTCHVASAFYTSGFEDSLVLIIDGHGSNGVELMTQAFYRADSDGFTPLYARPNRLAALDIGFTYESFSYHLGFENEEFDAGKTMGLSAYGAPRLDWREPLYALHKGHVCANPHYVRYHDIVRGTTRRVRNLCPRRHPESPIEPAHKDAAAFLQRESERILLKKVASILKEHPSERLCVAGGVAMNGLMMNRLRTEMGLRKVFVPPMPNDAGSAVGAALHGSLCAARTRHLPAPIRTSAWGRPYATDDVPNLVAAKFKSLTHERLRNEERLLSVVVQALVDGAVIGWMQGGAEFGPRALGHRSILCDPRRAEMKDRVNSQVKKREAFRPFAPMILSEMTKQYFDFDGASRFMCFITPVTELARKEIPAVVHADGTARLQTVHKESNGLFYRLLESFHRATGVPVLLNTSFNLAGEPIVETPEDALSTFVRSGMEMLVIGDYVLTKGDS